MSLFRSKLLVPLVLVVAGCGPRIVTAPSPPATSTSASSDDVLTSALYQLHPENYGINSSLDKPVSLLNSWRSKQTEKGADQPEPVKAPAGWVPESDEPRLAQAKFDLGDAVHIRDGMLYHTIAGYLSDRANDDVQRVNVIVEFVCRNVALWKDDEIELPFTPYITLQLGLGSADDRAWVCAEILKQLRIDSVIIRATVDVKETSDKWLLGVLIDGQIYLYDLRLGLPLKSHEATSTATLAEMTSHPECLEQMSVNEPYRLTADDLRDPSIFVVPDPNFWCRRMRNLEQVLPANDACILYDPLMDEEGHPGMLSRISAIGHWPGDSLKLWKYPRRQLEAAQRSNEATKQEMARLVMPFSVPIPFSVDKEGKTTMGSPERKMQKFRTDQLMGKFDDATKRYLSIRHLEVERNPPELDRLNRMASEDALYWTALCKFEAGQYEGAIEQLLTYLKKYDRKGKWYFPATLLLAQSRAEMGQFPEAITILSRPLPGDPYRKANAVKVKRWANAGSK